MSTVLRLRVPVAPVPAARPRVVRRGRSRKTGKPLVSTHYPRAYQTFRDESEEFLSAAAALRESNPTAAGFLTGPVEVSILLLMRRPKSMPKRAGGGRLWHDKAGSMGGDVDNLAKAILDEITRCGKHDPHRWWRDDAQVSRLSAIKLYRAHDEPAGFELVARSLKGIAPPRGDEWMPDWAR